MAARGAKRTLLDFAVRKYALIAWKLVPLAGIEPALLAELDFESSASTNSATGAFRDRPKDWQGRGRKAGGI
jgi:hypothetical protein